MTRRHRYCALLLALLPGLLLADPEETEADHASDLFTGTFEAPDSISALSALARIKQETGEYQEALDVWEQTLERVREKHGRWDQGIADAHAGLGASYHGLERYDEALEHYGQAVYINRMNQGLHDPSQIHMLDRMTELHALRDEWEEANQLQEYAFYVNQREHGRKSPEILPALTRMADWYRRTGAILSARALYERAAEIVEEAYGPDDIRLVEPLQNIALTYRLERYPVATGRPEERGGFRITTSGHRATPGSQIQRDQAMRSTLNPYGVGERALVRSVELQLEHPDVSTQERAEALIELADWYLLFDKWNQSMDTYGRAIEQLREAGWDAEQINARFAEPQALVFPVPSPPSPPPWTDGMRLQEGHVDLHYDVTNRGRLRNVEIADSHPQGLLDFRMRKAVRAARFRPRLLDGEPVSAEGMEFRHNFVYYSEATAKAEHAER